MEIEILLSLLPGDSLKVLFNMLSTLISLSLEAFLRSAPAFLPIPAPPQPPSSTEQGTNTQFLAFEKWLIHARTQNHLGRESFQIALMIRHTGTRKNGFPTTLSKQNRKRK